MEQRTTHTLIKKSTCANKKGKDMEKLLKQKKKYYYTAWSVHNKDKIQGIHVTNFRMKSNLVCVTGN